MKRHKMTSIVALLAAGALALTACARNEPDDGGGDGDENEPAGTFAPGFYEKEASGEPTPGGTLTIADYAEGRTLDPSKAVSGGYSGGSALVAVYDQLVRWNQRDDTFEYRLAESVEPNEDHTEWTITLREGVKFSDGTPLNADALLGSFNYYIENHGFDFAVVAPKWIGAEKVDDRTVQVNLKQSWATFPFALGTGMGFIVAPAAIENGPDGFKPIGAGAFTFESYKPTEELVFAKNPNFWEGEPYLDKLRMVWLGADETKYESFQAGSVQSAVMRDTNVINTARQADTSGWMELESLGLIIQVNRADGRPGSNPKVSEAIAHGVDEKALFDRVFDGLGIPSKHLFPEGSQWYNPDVEVPEYDPEKATTLLNEAKSEGFDGTLRIISLGDPNSRDIGLTLQAQLETIGFTVENDFIRSVPDFIAKLHIERDYDFARSALSVSDADPYWRLFSGFESTSPANAYAFSDPEFDKLLAELAATPVDERQEAVTKVEQRFLETLPAITLGGNSTFVIWSDDVHGVQPTNDSMIGFEKTWIAN